MSESLPYEIWYNGDVAKQVQAGTYAQCRPVFEEWVSRGKMTAERLGEFDGLASFKPKKDKKK